MGLDYLVDICVALFKYGCCRVPGHMISAKTYDAWKDEAMLQYPLPTIYYLLPAMSEKLQTTEMLNNRSLLQIVVLNGFKVVSCYEARLVGDLCVEVHDV